MIFKKFDKIPRLNRDCVATEKIDGTNAQIVICDFVDIWEDMEEDCTIDETHDFIKKHCLNITSDNSYGDRDDQLYIFAGSRTRWLTTEADNAGFASWVQNNQKELINLGKGRHYGEWWGRKIQRGYSLKEKRLSLFNTKRWCEIGSEPGIEQEVAPACCHVVPVLYEGPFNTMAIDQCLDKLEKGGSIAAKGYQSPEGIVIYHKHGGVCFKATIQNDGKPKTML